MVIAATDEQISFGGHKDFDQKPTAAEQMQTIANLWGDARAHICNEKWTDKTFNYHFIMKPSNEGKWSIGLRCDEVTKHVD